MTLDHLLKTKTISKLDYHFARQMERLSQAPCPEMVLAAALVSNYASRGHVCIDLHRLTKEEEMAETPLPETTLWLERLKRSQVVGRPGDFVPLILEGPRLYLHRYWVYEKEVARAIQQRAGADWDGIDFELLKSRLEREFPQEATTETNMQKLAAFASLASRFCVISGGPGTGKTFTVARIVALLKEQAGDNNFLVALAAPTGKAAARLNESLARSLGPEDIPGTVGTIHRLLGAIPFSPRFRHNEKHPLPHHLVIVDEASMVSIPLMARLVRALKPDTRLILLGDHHQLASVEPGGALGDICHGRKTGRFSPEFRERWRRVTGEEIKGGPVREEKNAKETSLGDSLIRLEKNYRFDPKSGIGALSRAVQEGRAEDALDILKAGEQSGCVFKPLVSGNEFLSSLETTLVESYTPCLKAKSPEEAFALLGRFRLLCALRGGPFGVEAINRLTEGVLQKKGLIDPKKQWYQGRPIMVNRNDYTRDLYNGDTGIVWSDPEGGGKERAFFQDQGEGLRRLPPQLLPEHETVFAMTAHKSQGSEFDRTVLLLPDHPSPVLTRELVYTAITRAKETVEVWGTEDIFRYAVSRHVERTSGLSEALWNESL